MEQSNKCLAVVRIRGVSDIHKEVNDTMRMLHLTRKCHATLVDSRPSYLGMLRRTRNYVAWGEISENTLHLLLKKRGRLIGDKRLTDDYAQKVGKKSLDELAEAILKGEIEFSDLPSIKPVFRLHPPKKGFRGKTKRSYASGGVAGNQGEAINDLLEQMI